MAGRTAGGDESPKEKFDELWPNASVGLLWRSLSRARAELGDDGEKFFLDLEKQERDLEVLRDRGERRLAELGSLKDELPKLREEHKHLTKQLEASERERATAESWAESGRVEELLKIVANIRSQAGKVAKSANMHEELESTQKRVKDIAVRIRQEQRRLEELRKVEVAEAADLQRPVEVNMKGNDVEDQLATEQDLCRQLTAKAHEEADQARLLERQERGDEARMRQVAAEQARQVERLKLRLSRAQIDVKHCMDGSSARWAGQFARQLATRDDRNWQLQRRVAAASKSVRASESSCEEACRTIAELEERLRRERALHSACLERCAEARDEAVAIDAARPGGYQAEAADQALRMEVDALRREVAREADWLQAEMATLLPERGGALGRRWAQLGPDEREPKADQ